MKIGQWFAIACGVALIAGTTSALGQTASAVTAGAPDALVEVKSKDFDRVYVRPGTDFRAYTKVTLGPTQVAFADRWLSDMNFHRIAVLQGTTVADAERIAQDTRTGLRDVFAAQFQRAGYEVVAAPGAGVLGLSVRGRPVHSAPASHAARPQPRVYARGRVRTPWCPRSTIPLPGRCSRVSSTAVWLAFGRSPPECQDHDDRFEPFRFRRHCLSGRRTDRRVEVGVAGWR